MVDPNNPKKTLIVGALWSVGARWAIKGIGFINTVIMARLLMPADYGVVAMAMLVVALIQALLDFGAGIALLRKVEVSKDEIDSAWTLRLLQSVAVAVILIAIAPLASRYFNEPRVINVLLILAVCVALSGAGNIGMVLALKEFKFSLEFRYNVISKVLSVIATVVAGYFLRDYRALVVGIAFGYIAGLVLSYVMHPYRARWNTSKIGEIWAVTKWLMFSGVGTFLLRNTDELVAARIGSTNEYGVYNVGSDLGRLPVGELGPAMMRAFLPVLTSIQSDMQRTNEAVIKTLSAVNAITLPVGFGVAALSVPLVEFILGVRWIEATPFVAMFALLGSIQFATSPLNSLLIMRGYTRSQNMGVWVEFLVFLIAALIVVPKLHIVGLVWARLFAAFVNFFFVCFVSVRYCGLSFGSIFFALFRSLVAAALMGGVVFYVAGFLDAAWLKLFVGVLFGVVVYSLLLLICWISFGRPDGLESTLTEYLISAKG